MEEETGMIPVLKKTRDRLKEFLKKSETYDEGLNRILDNISLKENH